jgi:hypothetical protein
MQRHNLSQGRNVFPCELRRSAMCNTRVARSSRSCNADGVPREARFGCKFARNLQHPCCRFDVAENAKGVHQEFASAAQAESLCYGPWFFGRDFNLDIVSLDPHLEGVDLDSRVVAPFAVVDAEPPGVPGTGDDSLLDVAAGQRRAHVRAEIVDGKERTSLVEYRHHPTVDSEGAAGTFGNVANLGDGREFHCWSLGRFVAHTVDSNQQMWLGVGPVSRRAHAAFRARRLGAAVNQSPRGVDPGRLE